MADRDIQLAAYQWVAKLDATDQPEELWPGVNAWLDADPAHQAAFRHAESLLRIATAAVRNLAPRAGANQFHALCETLHEERGTALFGK
jgi:ferric-dicitrate binding protein FerR (iron transport regulator)